ncbi:D-inositol-3-phosphate glycosyltransferase [Koleobacter methoxysyntrophicus]|uniref:D-inositol-3-phosphate glycosyltransferase n=1 Tax=Koleobacter methoxysyntrophicus TaxID=2751313 RepID=A0A8A0RI58_9FIRM|nr:glycosyltransferase [Koleobacter methoxysyntrophicus]QSQ07955.1 D-inositol-3-phosphate glycosyltransferase [Koleobacter methoxysyntrophicus]
MIKKIVIAGTLPPPVGGVTIHTKRLKLLLDEIGVDNTFVNLRPQKNSGRLSFKLYVRNFLNCIKSSRKNILHYQLNNWIEVAVLSLLSKLMGGRVISTIHSFRPEEFSVMQRFFFNIGKKFIDVFIAPSETIRVKLIQYKVIDSKIIVLNTYLPPSESELNEKLPDELMKFINNSEKVVVANAYKLYLDENNVDVYGLDMCIEVCARIPEINFIFCVPIIEDKVYFEKCLEMIKAYSIEDRFLIYNKNISLVSLFRYADVFVRPTSTDSFGISVAEAISCGVPAIASDVCERAKGTVIFKSRNIEDFEKKIKYVISKDCYDYNQKEQSDYIIRYIDLYDTIGS